MGAHPDIKLYVALLLFCQFSYLSEGSWISELKSTCRTVTAISCRALSVAGGAALGASVGNVWGAAAGAAGGQVLSEVCTPVSKWLCGKRRRTLADPSEFYDYERENAMYLFPQSFSEYEVDDSGISMDKFIVGVQDALPGHLHRYSVIANAFDKADLNDDGFLDMKEFSKGSWIAGGKYFKLELSENLTRGESGNFGQLVNSDSDIFFLYMSVF